MANKSIYIKYNNYCRWVAFAEVFKAYATSIITRILDAPFHKSCRRCQMGLRALCLFHSLQTQNHEDSSILP